MEWTKTPPNNWSDMSVQQQTQWTAAFMIAHRAHEGQVDKAGQPYINHVRRVSSACETIDGQIVGLLHDVLEDAPSYGDMVRLFPDHIVAAVEALTKPYWMDYNSYIAHVAQNEIATEVKLADLADNMDLKRFENPTPVDEERSEKYAHYQRLLTSLKLMRAAMKVDEN